MSADRWVVLLAHGSTFVGVLRDAEDGPVRIAPVMHPAYQLQTQIAQTPKGTAIIRAVTPIGLFAKWTTLTVPEGAAVLPFDDLTRAERDDIMRGVQVAEQMRLQLTAAGAGIALATNMPKGGA